MTVASVIDRTYREYLQAPDEQPSRFRLAAAMTSGETTLSADFSDLPPEEEDLVASGVILEVDQELIYADSDPDASDVITVLRGQFGTTAAAHDNGAFVFVAPTYPRRTVFDAVADSIETLWPDLWTVGVEETFAAVNPIELPSDAGGVLDLLVNVGARWRRLGTWTDLQDFPLSSTGNAVQIFGVPTNAAIQVYYQKKTTRPTLESDLLADLGVEDGWVKAVVVGAVAQLAASIDLDAATVEHITETLKMQGFPPGSGRNIRDALLQFADFQLASLKHQVTQKQHARVYVDDQY